MNWVFCFNKEKVNFHCPFSSNARKKRLPVLELGAIVSLLECRRLFKDKPSLQNLPFAVPFAVLFGKKNRNFISFPR